MRVNRSPGAARNPDPATTGRLPGLRLGSGAVRVMSVTALATATCALWAIPASAAPVAHASPSARHSAAQAAHRAAKKHSSKIAVSATPATAYADASVSLSATVKSSGKTPKGTVTFTAGGKKLCVGRLSHRSTHCSVKFGTAGTYSVKGTYSGDSTHAKSSGKYAVTVERYTTTTTLKVTPAEPTAGANVTLSATVASTGAGAPAGIVTFSSASKAVLCTGKLAAGAAQCSYTWPDTAAPTSVIGTYSGDGAHGGSSGTAAVKTGLIATTTNITAPDPVATEPAGTPYTIEVTVTSASGPAATGTVKLEPTNLGANPEANLTCTATLTAGAGSCQVDPPVGTWGFILYQATYSGDATHAASATPAGDEHKLITPDITTTTLTFNPAAATVNEADTLSAAVVDEGHGDLSKGAGGPDLVTFTAGGAAIKNCTGVPVKFDSMTNANVATCSYTPTAPGTVQIGAAYGGDLYTTPSSDTETLNVGS
jgi:hypothetical protein